MGNLEIPFKNMTQSVGREEIACATCGGKEYRVLYPFIGIPREEIAQVFSTTSKIFCREQVVRCKNCDLIYVNPRLPEELIYDGYQEGEDPDYVSQAKARMATFENSLGFIERFRQKKPGTVLDIGAAGGIFLKVAKDKGWTVFGIEPNQWLANYSRQNFGIEVLSKKISELGLKQNSLDLVTLWDVLEHVSHPDKMMEEIHPYIKPDGLLVISYPDISTWGAKILRRRWWFMLDVHLTYFTKKTLRAFLKNHGFEVIAFKPLFQKLYLDYLAKRMFSYSENVGRFALMTIKGLGLSNIPLTYTAGQRIALCRPIK